MAKIILSNERLEGISKGNVKGSPWAKFKFLYRQRPGLNRPNIFMLLFFLPALVAVFLLNRFNSNVNVALPYFSNIAVGFPFAPYAEAEGNALLASNTQWFFLGLILAAAIFSVSFGGAIKVIRNGLVSIKVDSQDNATCEISSKRDFLKGIKENWLVCLAVFLLWGAAANGVYYLYVALASANTAVMIIVMVAASLVAALLIIYGMFVMTLSAGYKQRFGKTLKNAFFMTFQNMLSNLLALVITVAPFAILLFNNDMISLVLLMYYAMIGFAITVYVWTYQSTRIENRYPKYKTVN